MKKMSKVLGMSSYSISEGRLVGTVHNLLFHKGTGAIQGWMIKSTHFFSKIGGISSKDVRILGEDIVLINSGAQIEWGRDSEVPSDFLWAKEYHSTPFLSRDGKQQGVVQDIVLSTDADQVLGFVLSKGVVLPMGEQCRLGVDSGVVTDTKALQVINEKEEPFFWAQIKEELSSKN